MLKRLHVKYPLFLLDLHKTPIFSTYFQKKAQISSFIKMRPVGAGLFHADGQTEEANSRFSRFSDSAQNEFEKKNCRLEPLGH